MAHCERTAPERMRVLERDRVVDRLPEVLRHDRRLPADVVEVRHRGGLELEGDLAALPGDALEHRPDGLQVERRVLLQQLEGVEDVGGRERLAVGPPHSRPDREGDRLIVIRPGVLRGEPRRRGSALELVDKDKRLVHGPERPVDEARVEGVESARPGRSLLVRDRDRRAGSRLAGGGRGFVAGSAAGGGPQRRDGCGKRHDEKPSSHLVSLLGRHGAVLGLSDARR